MKTPLFALNTYTDEAILSDSRVIVENILREKGLLFSTPDKHAPVKMHSSGVSSSYAVQRMLQDLPTPTKPRPETFSRQVSAAVCNNKSALAVMETKSPQNSE